MIMVEDVDSSDFLVKLFEEMYDDLPVQKSKMKKIICSYCIKLK